MKLPVIASDATVGQLGNTLLQSAHAQAFCREHGHYHINFPFTPYASHFAATRTSVLCSLPTFPWFPLSSGNRYRFLGLAKRLHAALGSPGRVRAIQIDWAEEVRMDDPAFPTLIQHDWLVALQGWRFRAPRLVEKHAAAIRHYFRPVTAIRQRVQRLVDSCRKQADILIGVHVRQGDYANWMGGRYFYGADVYERQMRQALTLFPDQRIHFILSSNDLPEALRQVALPVSFGTGLTAVDDLYTLAACDYILGPPSSFSLWASFYGQVPIHHIETPETFPTLDDFVVSRDLTWKFDV